MGLRKATGRMYNFVDYTWNVIKGRCSHDCSYCYMKRITTLGEMRFDQKELKTDLGHDNFIFIGSGCDVFCKDVPGEWINTIIDYCMKFDNKYLFQSKNIARMLEFLPDDMNLIVCTTIETDRWYPDIMGSCPTPQQRAEAMSYVPFPKYVTIEPIIDFDPYELVELIKMCEPIQVNIGTDSGDNNLPEPSLRKVLSLLSELQKFTNIFIKPSFINYYNK